MILQRGCGFLHILGTDGLTDVLMAGLKLQQAFRVGQGRHGKPVSHIALLPQLQKHLISRGVDNGPVESCVTLGKSPQVSPLRTPVHLFQNILQGKIHQEVKFSKHANARLENRNIELSDKQLERLNQGVGQARTKQIRESLVMMDNLAFIVNIKNNTVVTAMEQGESGQVFTNIDGAVIV